MGFLRLRPRSTRGYDMTAVPFSVDSFDLVLQELAKGAFAEMPPSERLVGFRTMFADAVRRSEDRLATQSLQCWSLAFKDAQPIQDQQVTEQAKLDILIEMFFVVHAEYKRHDYQRMNEALIAVFREILALWHPWMWDSCRKAFEFCAAAVAGMSTESEYGGWTDAMRLMRGHHIRKDERTIMVTLIQEKVNNEKNGMELFDGDVLEKWMDAYAYSIHFPEKVITALATACARKGGVCRARQEAMHREVCGHLHYLQAPRALKHLLKGLMRKGVDFQRRMQNAFSSHMWGKRESMTQDAPGKCDSFYGRIVVRYLSFERVQVDVVLPVDMSGALLQDMGRRAEANADYFVMVMGTDVALQIRISLHDKMMFCSAYRGERFDFAPLEATDLALDE